MTPNNSTPPAPALLTTAQLAELQRTVDDEQTNHAGEPVTKMGYWPTAVAALLGHAGALAAESAHSNDCAQRAYAREIDAITARNKAEVHATETSRELEYTRQMGRETETAMVKLADRVKRQQDELSEQEVAKLALVQQLDRVCHFACNHHQAQPSHVLLHALEVDIPAMCCEHL